MITTLLGPVLSVVELLIAVFTLLYLLKVVFPGAWVWASYACTDFFPTPVLVKRSLMRQQIYRRP
jgi:hypothetical protein